MSLQPSASLAIVQELEALAEHNHRDLVATREQNDAGEWICGLKDPVTGKWFLAFSDGAEFSSACYAGLLLNNSHTLIALARIGLQACGITDAGENLGVCRRCGSPQVELTRVAVSSGEVLDIVCYDCNTRLAHIIPFSAPADAE